MPDPDVVEFNLFVHNQYPEPGHRHGLSRICFSLLANAWDIRKSGSSKAATTRVPSESIVRQAFAKTAASAMKWNWNSILTECLKRRNCPKSSCPPHPQQGASIARLPHQSEVLSDTRSVILYSPRFEEFTIGKDHPFVTARSRLFLDMCERHGLLHLPGTQILEPVSIDENSVLVFSRESILPLPRHGLPGYSTPTCSLWYRHRRQSRSFLGVLEYAMLTVGASVMGSRPADFTAEHRSRLQPYRRISPRGPQLRLRILLPQRHRDRDQVSSPARPPRPVLRYRCPPRRRRPIRILR